MSKNLVIGIAFLFVLLLGASTVRQYQLSKQSEMMAHLASMEAAEKSKLADKQAYLFRTKADSLTLALKACQGQVGE
ncbi:MAG: hypothetical protein AAF587_03950 [Bacteroidota bacterium]